MSAYLRWATANPELARQPHEAFNAGMTKAASVSRHLRQQDSPMVGLIIDKCVKAIETERDKP